MAVIYDLRLKAYFLAAVFIDFADLRQIVVGKGGEILFLWLIQIYVIPKINLGGGADHRGRAHEMSSLAQTLG
jgi:hypothetical protein